MARIGPKPVGSLSGNVGDGVPTVTDFFDFFSIFF